MKHAILRDRDHPLLDSGTAKVVGDHDDPTDDPHFHYSILTIENSRVVDVDWGYHGEDEAREHLGGGSKVVVRSSPLTSMVGDDVDRMRWHTLKSASTGRSLLSLNRPTKGYSSGNWRVHMRTWVLTSNP